MKFAKLKGAMFIAMACAGFAAGNASAAHLTADFFMESRTLANSGDQTLLEAFEQVTGNDYDLSDLVHLDQPGDAVWDPVEMLWSIDVSPLEPGYFMLKFGVGTTGEDTHWFFRNDPNLNLLVWSNAQVNGLSAGADCAAGDVQECRLSHYAFVPDDGSGNPGGDPLPEPASLALVGLGLAGMALRRRRR